MNRKDARDQLKLELPSYAQDNLTKSRKTYSRHMYDCPICDSGKGVHQTGALSVKDTYWRCFSCGAHGDIFDLIGIVEKCPDYNSQLKFAANLYGIALDTYQGSWKRNRKK